MSHFDVRAGAAEPSTSEKKEEETHDKSDKKPKKNRCHTCKKKTGLTGEHFRWFESLLSI